MRNALTLLDRLTSEQVGGETRDWIGFSTRDHRGAKPDPKTIHGPWRAWLRVRKDVPVERWFWGMSYPELCAVMPLLRKSDASWTDAEVARVRALGGRVYPYLLDKLTDNGFARDDRRVCDRANVLLRRLTGGDVGEIVRHEHMRIDPADSMRKHGWAISENRASMELTRRRWTERLLVGN